MANKIITIGNQNNNSSKYSLEVYSDISMIGYNISKLKYINKYNCDLAVDGYNNEFLETEDGYIIETNYNYDTITNNNIAQDNPTSSEKISNSIIHIDKLINIKAVFNSLHNIFHWIPGERVLNPEFGSNIRSLLYNGITEFNKEQIAAEIQQSISKWEPRISIVKIVDMTDVNDIENNTVCLDVIFSVPSLNNNEQYVYSYMQNKNN